MSATQQPASTPAPAPTPAPTIRNAGTVPVTPRKLFVNIPVGDLQRSIEFFEALGFTFNPHFTDATATCMLVGEDAYFMLITRERFATFSGRPVDVTRPVDVSYAITVESREAVDEMIGKVVAAGGSEVGDPQDHGFMFQRSFHDLDGHHWEVFWMDPSAVPG
ncbi:MAG TPA: VOC family protein [Gemmatimonadales bacterium]